MRVSVLLGGLLAGAASAAVGGPGSRIVEQTRAMQSPLTVPGRYIVEFEDGHDGAAFDRDLRAANASRTMDLDFRLFRGASVQVHADGTVTDGADGTTLSAEQLAMLPAVRRVWPMRRYPMPTVTKHWASNVAGGAQTDEDHERRETAEERRGRLRKRWAKDTFSTHVMTQVDELRAKGFTGEGIRVGVVDTGVDYLHPDLGGCFGPGCLVSFGYDLVGNAYNGSNTPHPSGEPPMDCDGHGTHVSGIIAAQGNNDFGLTGAAPGVQLGMFRVFGCTGDVQDDVLIAAFNRAYEAGADLITSSIGGSSGWPEEAWSVAVARIVADGVPCTVSAGNSGASGLFYASTAADGHAVAAVASVDNTELPMLLNEATYVVGNGSGGGGRDGRDGNTTFGYTAGSPANWTGVTLPLWAPDFDTTNPADGCEPFGPGPHGNGSLAGHVVLIRRGTCLFTIKAAHAAARGAHYVLLYNNVAGTVEVDVSSVAGIRGMAMVTAEQGATWIAALARNETVRVAMTDPAAAAKSLTYAANRLTPGLVSTFSSWGPTFEVDIKPLVAAPGGSILSTFPRDQGAYAVLSGTSMACPMLAGIYALLMEARRTRDPRLLATLVASTARPVRFSNGAVPAAADAPLAPVPQQGAGLVQAAAAAAATTLLTVAGLSFNDSDHHVALRNLTLTNRGRTSVVYALVHVGAATAYTFASDTALAPAAFPAALVLTTQHASLNLSSNATGVPDMLPAVDRATITVPAGQRRVLSVAAAPPVGLDVARLPVYSGYLAINGSDGTALSLPYLGVAGSLAAVTVLDPVDTYLSPPSGPSANATRAPPDYEFVLPPPRLAPNASSALYANRTVLVQANINLVMGAPLVRADLVPLKMCPVAPGGPPAPVLREVLGYRSLGPIDSFPLRWLSRDPVNATWDGTMADGTSAPAGLYKLVIRALHIFGDPARASDYDVVETDPFRLRYLDAPKTTAGTARLVRRSAVDECG